MSDSVRGVSWDLTLTNLFLVIVRFAIEREASPATIRNTDNTVVMTTDTAVKIADLAVEGSVVAVAADDNANYDYCLLKVKSNSVEELADNT